MEVNYLQAAISLLFVISLIWLVSFALKRFSLDKHMLKKTGDKKRITIEEVQPIDARRRLMLIRRDNREHLILIGASSELLIESNDIEEESK